MPYRVSWPKDLNLKHEWYPGVLFDQPKPEVYGYDDNDDEEDGRRPGYTSGPSSLEAIQ